MPVLTLSAVLQRRDICRYLDAQGLPDCNQRYVIPESFSSLMSSFHNRGIYSIWNHFAEFCAHNSRLQEEQRPIERDPFFQVSNYLGNRHVFGTYRLKIFVHLSTVPEAAPNTGKLELSFVSGVTTASGGSGTPDRPPVASPLAPAETTALTISQLLASPGTPLLGYNTHVPDSPAMPQRNPVIPPAPSAHTVTPTASVTTPLAAYRPQLSHISPIRTPSMFTPRADASPFRPAAQPVAKPKGGDRVGIYDDDWILRALEPVPVPMEKKKTHARAAAAAVEREPEADEPLDSIVLANTQLNYLLSRTLSPIPAVESRPMFTSPKGKSVVWADTQKAKLERWEGESTSTLSEGSGADDLDCWAAMDALELTSLSEEADIPSGAVDSPPRPEVWGRLEELQRQTSEGIFGQAGEAGCAAAVEKGADLDEREGVRLTALSDDEWLSRQMAHTVGVEQAQLPTVSQRGDGDFLGWSADATAAGRFFWAGSNSALEGLDLGLTGQDSGGWGSSGGDRKEGGGVGPWEVPKDDNQAATDDAIGRLCNDLG